MEKSFKKKDQRYYKKRQKKETSVPKKENCRKLWTSVHTSMLKHCRQDFYITNAKKEEENLMLQNANAAEHNEEVNLLKPS